MTVVNPGDYIQIYNDMWEDHGKIFLVHKAIYKEDTTAVSLILDYDDEIIKRTVARYQIVKVN